MNLKLYSWNVNGIRATAKQGFHNWLEQTNTDILCIQETKAHPDQLSKSIRQPLNYQSFFHSAERKGYSGVATYVKKELEVQTVGREYSKPAFDQEGRIIEIQLEGLTIFNVYFPNGKRDAERLRYKKDFYDFFLNLINDRRDKGESVIFCGDVNTAHKEIDLTNPKPNSKFSGFLPEERAWMDKLVNQGWIDTFRELHKEPEHYTWWSLRTNARERNVGWRIDYFFIDQSLRENLVAAQIHPEVLGSDHCPISITMSFED